MINYTRQHYTAANIKSKIEIKYNYIKRIFKKIKETKNENTINKMSRK